MVRAQEIVGYDMNCVHLAKSPIFLDFRFLICTDLLEGLNKRMYRNNTEYLNILAIK